MNNGFIDVEERNQHQRAERLVEKKCDGVLRGKWEETLNVGAFLLSKNMREIDGRWGI